MPLDEEDLDALEANTLTKLIFIHETITLKDINLLSQALRKNSSFKDLTVKRCKFEKDVFNLLMQIVKNHPSLSFLYLGQNAIKEEEVELLADALKENNHLTSLQLSTTLKDPIGITGIRALFQSIKSNHHLHSLKLLHINMNEEIAQILAETLKGHRSLSSLTLSNCHLDAKGLPFIADALKNHSILARLSLSSNQLKIEGAQLIAEILKENKYLTSLDLSSNDIGIEGAEALITSLKENPHLTHLNLAFNHLEAKGATLITQLLKENSYLLSLDISHNNIGVEGTKAIAEELKKNQSLAFLNLSNNQLGVEGANMIADALKENQHLVYLRLYNNHIQDEGVSILIEALKRNKSLLSMDNIDFMDVMDGISRQLRQEIKTLLQQNQTIPCLILAKLKNHCELYLADYQAISQYKQALLLLIEEDKKRLPWDEQNLVDALMLPLIHRIQHIETEFNQPKNGTQWYQQAAIAKNINRTTSPQSIFSYLPLDIIKKIGTYIYPKDILLSTTIPTKAAQTLMAEQNISAQNLHDSSQHPGNNSLSQLEKKFSHFMRKDDAGPSR